MNTLWCALQFSAALTLQSHNEVRESVPLAYEALIYLSDDAADIADALRACDKPSKANEIEVLGRRYLLRAHELEDLLLDAEKLVREGGNKVRPETSESLSKP